MTNDQKPVLGIIGGIGSGKSAAAIVMAKYGGRVVAGDPAGHEALRQPAIKQRITDRWPTAVATDGEIDRKRLGRIVFADPIQLRELESMVFPWIKNRLREDISAAQADPEVRFVVLDAAVMLEAGWTDVCDKLIFVEAPRAIRIARVKSRGWTGDDLDRRERSQMTLEEKKALADAILDNASGLDALERNAQVLLEKWGLMNQPT
jgi:dephospho-CoA kinase